MAGVFRVRHSGIIFLCDGAAFLPTFLLNTRCTKTHELTLGTKQGMLKKKLGVGVWPAKRLRLKTDGTPYCNRAGFALLLWLNLARFALRQGGTKVNDIIWDSIKPMVFFVTPLVNLAMLILWKRRFYQKKWYEGKEQRKPAFYSYHKRAEKNEEKRKQHNRFWLIFLLGSWDLVMLAVILYIIYR